MVRKDKRSKVDVNIVPNWNKMTHVEARKHVEASSALYAEFLLSCEGLAGKYVHQVIDRAQYLDGPVHRENFQVRPKRGINDTYVSVKPLHLFPYLDEQAFRYNHREGADGRDRFDAAVCQIVNKRLMFDELTGQDQF